MSPVDAYNGQDVRRGGYAAVKPQAVDEEDLVVVSPQVDGRLADEGRN